MPRGSAAYTWAEVPLDLSALSILGPDVATHAATVVMGVALAATCGIRAFLPLLVVNLLAMTGKVELGESFQFLATWPATLLFGTATVAELAGDKFPGVDHLLDVFGALIRPAAATVVAASVVTHWDPLTACAFGMIGGGMSAGVVFAAKAQVRMLSTALTGGMANAVISVIEDGVAVVALILAVLAPLILSAVVLGVLAVVAAWAMARSQRRLVSPAV
jgi:hypothetical protein